MSTGSHRGHRSVQDIVPSGSISQAAGEMSRGVAAKPHSLSGTGRAQGYRHQTVTLSSWAAIPLLIVRTLPSERPKLRVATSRPWGARWQWPGRGHTQTMRNIQNHSQSHVADTLKAPELHRTSEIEQKIAALPAQFNPLPMCPTNNFVLKKYGPNGSVRWTHRTVRATIL